MTADEPRRPRRRAPYLDASSRTRFRQRGGGSPVPRSTAVLKALSEA